MISLMVSELLLKYFLVNNVQIMKHYSSEYNTQTPFNTRYTLRPFGARATQTSSRACAGRWNALCGGLFRHILQALQTLHVCLFGLAKRRIPFRVMCKFFEFFVE
jgi:hypothetical protein